MANEKYYAGMEVSVWDLPEEKPGDSPYMGTEHCGRITE